MTNVGSLAGRRARWWAVLALGLVTAGQLWLLWPELGTAPFPLNDDGMHLAASLEAGDRLTSAPATALDPWFSYWSFGYPLWHAYQPLPHLATGVVMALVPAEPLATFTTLKVLLLLIYPWAVFLCGRLLRLGRTGSAFAAALAPIVASDGLFGFEYGSYVWRGTGLYTQVFGMVLLPLAFGLGTRALRTGRGLVWAGLLLGATALSHAVFGYVTVVCLLVAAVALPGEVGWRVRLRRLVVIGGVAAMASAFFVVPMLLDREAILHSRWEPAWKWDGFGLGLLARLARGQVFDQGRWPWISLWVATGLGVAAWRRGASARLLALPFAVLVVLLFGRPTWGLLRDLYAPADLHLHRLVGGLHLFGVLLAGLALDFVRERARGWVLGVPVAVGLVTLGAGVRERAAWIEEGNGWARASEEARAKAAPALARLRELVQGDQGESPGRLYPGLAAGWGRGFRVGYVPISAFAAAWRVDALSFLYHAMSPPADVMPLFDETRADHYRVFDVRLVAMPQDRPPPPFLRLQALVDGIAVYRAPGQGRIRLAHAGDVCPRRGEPAFACSSAWLDGPGPGQGAYALQDAQAVVPSQAYAGRVENERREGDAWSADVVSDGPALVVLAESFHPRWRVEADGVRLQPVQVAPGFIAATVPAGRHRVTFRWSPGPVKAILLLLGALGVGGISWLARNRPGNV